MRSPVTMRFRLEDDLRRRFRSAAHRSQQSSSEVLRFLMAQYVAQELDPFAADLTVWSNIRHAADRVARKMPRHAPACTCEDIDQDFWVRRKDGAHPGFGRG